MKLIRLILNFLSSLSGGELTLTKNVNNAPPEYSVKYVKDLPENHLVEKKLFISQAKMDIIGLLPLYVPVDVVILLGLIYCLKEIMYGA